MLHTAQFICINSRLDSLVADPTNPSCTKCLQFPEYLYCTALPYPGVQVSVVTKIVPSPDWFIGLHGLQLCQEGAFMDTFTTEVWHGITRCVG